jgi:hypothetical protein
MVTEFRGAFEPGGWLFPAKKVVEREEEHLQVGTRGDEFPTGASISLLTLQE